MDKPAGILTIADHGGSTHAALVAGVARTLGVPEGRVHPTSRLDRDVSGVVFFALSAAAASRLSAARAEGTYVRRATSRSRPALRHRPIAAQCGMRPSAERVIRASVPLEVAPRRPQRRVSP